MSNNDEFNRTVDLAMWWIEQHPDYFTVIRKPDNEAGRGRPDLRYVTQRDIDLWMEKGTPLPGDKGNYRQASDPYALFQFAHFLRQSFPSLNYYRNRDSAEESIVEAMAKAHRKHAESPNSQQGIANILSSNGLHFSKIVKKQ